MKYFLRMTQVCYLILFLSSCTVHSKDELTLSGTLEVTEHALGAPVGGRLQELFVDEGQMVKRGELLATLDRYAQTKKNYERTLQIFKDGGATQQAVENAELAYKDQSIVAPVDGVVLLKVHEIGEVVSPGAAVLQIGEINKLWIRVFVPEGVINHVSLNQAARIKFDGLEGTFKGHIDFISPKAEFTPRNVQTPEERVTQTFAIKVVVDDVVPNLRPGVSADVILDLNGNK